MKNTFKTYLFLFCIYFSNNVISVGLTKEIKENALMISKRALSKTVNDTFISPVNNLLYYLIRKITWFFNDFINIIWNTLFK
ncbi:hypothetical protein AB836_01475 [Rickettsiales bacterium (ex Bugula neritina AB1)]|nr:hypothetical protein AB836_01475 [Rickettsiales bacterium (ex Bugula neritina AB1)]